MLLLSGQTQAWPIRAKAPHIHADWNLVGDQENNALLSERQMRTNAPNIHKDWNFGEWSENNNTLLSGQNS